jgi:hypothetical protein
MKTTDDIKYSLLKWYGRCIIPAKLLGILFLSYYLITTPQHYDLIWVFVYLGIALLGISSIAIIFYTINFFIKDKLEEKLFSKDDTEEKLIALYYTLKRSPWLVLLIPGEDGFFFLPLLYIGITPITAAIAAILFGFAHVTSKPIFACVITSIIAFLSILIVLPHGILPLCVGHIILDISIFSILPTVLKRHAENHTLLSDEYDWAFDESDLFEEVEEEDL